MAQTERNSRVDGVGEVNSSVVDTEVGEHVPAVSGLKLAVEGVQLGVDSVDSAEEEQSESGVKKEREERPKPEVITHAETEAKSAETVRARTRKGARRVMVCILARDKMRD